MQCNQVSRKSGGEYQCQAVNSEGTDTSAPLTLNIMCKWIVNYLAFVLSVMVFKDALVLFKNSFKLVFAQSIYFLKPSNTPTDGR